MDGTRSCAGGWRLLAWSSRGGNVPLAMMPPQRNKNERDFIFVVKAGTALSLGLMAAFLFSLKSVHPSIQISFTLGTVAAFLIAAVASWKFCAVLYRDETGSPGDDGIRREETQKKLLKRWITAFIGVSSLLTLLAFAWSLKDVGSESRRQVIEGTGLAVLVIGAVAWLLRVVVRFFEDQSRFEEELRRENQPPPDDDELP